MTYARTFSFASLLFLASLVYTSIASAQTTSYVPPAAYTNAGVTSDMTGSLTGTSSARTSSSTGSVLGASTTNPNVPNTGAGGDAANTLFALVWSGIAMIGGTALLLRDKLVHR